MLSSEKVLAALERDTGSGVNERFAAVRAVKTSAVVEVRRLHARNATVMPFLDNLDLTVVAITPEYRERSRFSVSRASKHCDSP
ncbi:hypothetical protein ACSBOB_00940 [Mesorhizobium sp. ASY16-5R]|uniref:hypothetical protein n=1 Tax=Mesorhizobium sp. ASY16-5R TaxID=3445772 RepID=UPI003FA10B68